LASFPLLWSNLLRSSHTSSASIFYKPRLHDHLECGQNGRNIDVTRDAVA
jgi:hypothetical protein